MLLPFFLQLLKHLAGDGSTAGVLPWLKRHRSNRHAISIIEDDCKKGRPSESITCCGLW